MECKAVCVAQYDYLPQADEELALKEGDILLVTENQDDPDWWTATVKPTDTFADKRSGLVPATYLEEAVPASWVVSLYPYAAASGDEISFPEDARIAVYDTSDPEWWFGKYGDSVGLIPATYVEPEGGAETSGQPPEQPVVHETPAEPTPTAPAPAPAALSHEEAEAQKKQLLSALGGFGFEKPKSTSARGSKENMGASDVIYYPVTEVDKKKKKNNRKGFLGVSDDYNVYFVADPNSKDILAKWEMAAITKFSEKKQKKLLLEIGGDEIQFEGEKHDILALHGRLRSLELKRTNILPTPNGPATQESPAGAKGPRVSTPVGAVPSPVSHAPAGHLPLPSPHKPAIVEHPPQPSPSPQPVQPPAEERKIAVALYDYEATSDEELTIRENDNLLVLDTSDEEWWRVRLISKKGKEGLVPASYVELKRPMDSAAGASGPPPMPPRADDLRQQEAERQRHQQQEEERRRAEQQRHEQMLRQQESEQRQNKEEAERRARLERDMQQRKDEEDARKSREAREAMQPKPALPRRPSIPTEPPHRPTPAVPPGRPPMPVPVTSKVSAPPAPSFPARPAVPTSRPPMGLPPGAKPPAKVEEKPNPANTRMWTDRSGTFKVEAEFIGISDGKVQLHKTNGVKIAVPLAKLDAKDIEFLRTIPGNESIPAPEAPKAPVAAGPSMATLAAAASAPIASAPTGNFSYNGFDWKEFLIGAGVSAGDAAIYGQKFVGERMDRSHLADLDRELLRNLGVTEGDIIRIRKAASLPAKTPSVIAAVNEKEQAALQNNMMLLGKQFGGASNVGGGSAAVPRKSSKASAAGPPNMHVIMQAADLLKASTAAGQRTASPHSSPPGTPVGRGSARSSFQNGAASAAPGPTNHDPWAVPASGKPTPVSNPHGMAPLQSQQHAPLASPALSTASGASANANVAANQQALLMARKQQEETQAALQQAQQALLKAQEQARQTAQVQAQAALMKAQETARQAKIMQQQQEAALLAAQQQAAARQQQLQMPPPPVQPQQQFIPQMNAFNPAMSMAQRPAVLPPPLIPTNSMSTGFIPVGGGSVPLRPGQQNLMNGGMPQTGSFSNPGNLNSGDKYSAFKSFDANEPTLFNPALAKQLAESNFGNPQQQQQQPQTMASPALSFAGSSASNNSGFGNPNPAQNMQFGAGNFLQNLARGPQQPQPGSQMSFGGGGFQPQQPQQQQLPLMQGQMGGGGQFGGQFGGGSGGMPNNGMGMLNGMQNGGMMSGGGLQQQQQNRMMPNGMGMQGMSGMQGMQGMQGAPGMQGMQGMQGGMMNGGMSGGFPNVMNNPQGGYR
ncbi:cytoskeletal protein binding protein [Geranomyces michiganensis]|nr:cytoskeletal protein binding protein [Geranomyces michiganensis]